MVFLAITYCLDLLMLDILVRPSAIKTPNDEIDT